MKLIAYYLPQYHEIPENNRFWGKGFTEWVNVKPARPLFRGHYQPRIPYHNNYYDLSDPAVMVKQMNLAEKCGIHGFCFYHYWFNGKKILEKPIEDILNNSEARLPFCIAWANEPWVTTWHSGGGKYEVLIEQKYGQEKEWLAHFSYLLQFFKDERYIKVDNKPMLLIYNLDEITCRGEMMACWIKKSREAGFDGLYIVSMKNSSKRKAKYAFVSATVDFQPKMLFSDSTKISKGLHREISNWKFKNGYKFSKVPILRRFLHTKFDYGKLNSEYIKCKRGKNQFRGVFVGYDDTPRRKEWSVLVRKSTPSEFEYYLKQNIIKSRQEGNDFMFINAWNEWGEGAYLEADERYGYQYLKAVKKALKAASAST